MKRYFLKRGLLLSVMLHVMCNLFAYDFDEIILLSGSKDFYYGGLSTNKGVSEIRIAGVKENVTDLVFPKSVRIIHKYGYIGNLVKSPKNSQQANSKQREKAANPHNAARFPIGITYSDTLKCNVVGILSRAFQNKTNIKKALLPDHIKELGTWAFAGCTNLEEVSIGSEITTIPRDVFYGCTSLKKISFSKGDEKVTFDTDAFYGCTALEKVIVDKAEQWFNYYFLTEKSNPLFYAHSLYEGDVSKPIEHLKIPDDIAIIYANAFNGAKCLKEITMSSSNNLKTIDMGAFKGCTNLQKVFIPNIQYWCDINFKDADANPLYYAEHLWDPYSYLEITKLRIPNSVDIIPDYAFYRATNLRRIEISGNVKSIGQYAFLGCIPERIYSRIIVPFEIPSNTFGTEAYNNSKLIVPNSGNSKELYQNTPAWKNFKTIFQTGEYIFEFDEDETNAETGTLTITCGSNGQIGYNGEIIKSTTKTFSFSYGANLRFSVSPDENYDVGVLTINGSDYTNKIINNELVLENVNDNVELSMSFVKKSPPMPAQPYVTLSTDNTVLTFYYDEKKEERHGIDLTPYTIPWDSQKGTITTVVFDESFAGFTELPSTRSWFYNCSNLTTIVGIRNLNTQNVVDMSFMFYGCSTLASLDVSKFNTVNVTYMDYLFKGCKSLVSIDLSNFNTENVTDMTSMFEDCYALTSLDVSSFNTQHVLNMDYMFYSCKSLSALDISNFNTQQVKDMYNMFAGCEELVTLDLGNLNTVNVTDMRKMFYGCSALTSLDVSSFNTSNVTTMSYMFGGCKSLSALDVSNFDTRNVSDMQDMFLNCNAITTLNVRNFDTHNVTNMSGMFMGCSALLSLNLSSFNTQKVTSMYCMFNNCKELKTVYVGTDWSTKKITNGDMMFNECNKLVGGLGTKYNSSHTDYKYAHIDGGVDNPGYFTDINTVVVTPSLITFADPVVKTICVEHWDTDGDGELSEAEAAAVTTFGEEEETIFYRNKKITSFDELRYFTGLTRLNTNAFYDCKNLASVILPANLPELGDGVFVGCEALTTIDIPASVTTIGIANFNGCLKMTAINVSEENPNYESVDGVLFTKGTDKKTLVAYPNGKVTPYAIPEGTEHINDYAFCYANVSDVTFPSTVRSIGECAFSMSKIEKVALPDDFETLGYIAFGYCYELTEVSLGNKLTSIPAEAFRECMVLKDVAIPETVTSIEMGVFMDCFILQDIKLPDGLKNIGNSAFAYCEKMTRIKLPATLEVLVEGAFIGTPLAEIVALMPTPPVPGESGGAIVFDDNVNANAILYVPYGTKSLYEQAKIWKKFTHIVEMSDGSPITITANDLTMVYGEAVPELTFKVEGGELVGTPALSCEVTSSSPVGTYPITISKGTVENPNVTYVAGTLTITKAPLTISGGTYAMKQGEALPEFKASYEGWKNNETEAVLITKPTLTTTATSQSEPGIYEIIVAGAEAQNYAITYVNGILTIEENLTGIDQIMVNENSKAMIFTIDGKRVDNLKKGLNVIRMKDGTIRKTVVK